MSLISDIKAICNRLAPYGWRVLLKQHGLDILAADLKAELAKPLAINRKVVGFEDFSLGGSRGIEPGKPAWSLLYHAFASPYVRVHPLGRFDPNKAYPTLIDIETVENYVYGAQPPTIQDLEKQTGALYGSGILGGLKAIMFSCEYRPSTGTTHGKHADLIFSRTGISRIGTLAAQYDPVRRTFTTPMAEPINDADPLPGASVMPARFVIYLAVQVLSDIQKSIPMNGGSGIGDENTKFWLPVHKIFAGNECLAGMSLKVAFTCAHVNEKLSKFHQWCQQKGLDSGQPSDILDKDPFTFTDGIAELASSNAFPIGWILPVIHPKFVEPAESNGQPLTYNVPPSATLSGSVRLDVAYDGVTCADILHARTKISDDGSVQDLSLDPNADSIIQQGGYKAQHYIDFTGDGWVSAEITVHDQSHFRPRGPQFPFLHSTRALAAYSIVASPRCLPACSEREVALWSKNLGGTITYPLPIWSHDPVALCDIRLAANFEITGASFDENDTTMTAIVPQFNMWPTTDPTPPAPAVIWRTSWMPDFGAGIQAPGWDVGKVSTNKTHLASYVLGSPFLEDAKLCAALSSYWPAVAPDSARRLGDRRDIYGDDNTLRPSHNGVDYRSYLNRTTVPFSDSELGVDGSNSWDGEARPRREATGVGQPNWYVIPRFDQADYVKQAVEGKWFPGRLAHLTVDQYTRRALAMALVYSRLVKSNAIDFIQQTSLYLVVSFVDSYEYLPLDVLHIAQMQSSYTFTKAPMYFQLVQRDSTLFETEEFNPDGTSTNQQAYWNQTSWRINLLPSKTYYFFVEPDEDVVLMCLSGHSWTKADRLA